MSAEFGSECASPAVELPPTVPQSASVEHPQFEVALAHPLQYMGRRTAASLMALTVALQGNAVSHEAPAEIVHPMLAATHMMVQAPEASAAPVRQSTLEKIEALVDAPTSQLLTHADEVVDQRVQQAMEQSFDTPRPKPVDYEAIQAAYEHEIRSTVAAEHGLHVHDPYRTTEQLSADLRKPNHEQMPAHEYMAIANDFLRQYDGLQLYYDGRKKTDGDLQPPTAAMMDSDTGRLMVLSLVRTIGELPVEYFSHIGTKQIHLTESKPGTQPGAAAYVTEGSTDIVFVMNTFSHGVGVGKTLLHEMEHLWDQKMTNRRRTDDPQFAALTGSLPYGEKTLEPSNDKEEKQQGAGVPPLLASMSGALTLDDFYAIRQTIGETYTNRDRDTDCSTVAAETDAKVARVGTHVYYPSHYAGTQIGEHKADLAKLTGDPSEYELAFSELLPHIREQAIQQLARKYEEAPGIVGYLIDMAEHPQQPTAEAKHLSPYTPGYFSWLCRKVTRDNNETALLQGMPRSSTYTTDGLLQQ
jgi:hypothetical protein